MRLATSELRALQFQIELQYMRIIRICNTLFFLRFLLKT